MDEDEGIIFIYIILGVGLKPMTYLEWDSLEADYMACFLVAIIVEDLKLIYFCHFFLFFSL